MGHSLSWTTRTWAAVCDHKDCDRPARPLFFTLYSRHGELLDELTHYVCPEHRDALFRVGGDHDAAAR